MRVLIFIVICIVLGYGAEWAPYYVNIFSGTDDLTVNGTLLDYEVPCKVSPTSDAFCSHEYQIPIRQIIKGRNTVAVGVGAVLSASQFICSSDPDRILKIYDDPTNPGRSYDTFNSYQTMVVNSHSCGDTLIIRAWSRQDAKRSGYVSGSFVYGSPAAVDHVRRLVEFYNRDIRTLMAFCVTFALLLYLVSRSHSESDIYATPFENYYLFWVGFLTVSSGLVQVILPILTPSFFGRVSAACSLIAHVGPGLIFIGKSQYFGRIDFSNRPTKVILCTTMAALSFSPYYVQFFAFSPFPLGFLCILAGLRSKSSIAIGYGLLLIVAGLKLQNISYTPNSHIVAIFASVILVASAIGRFSSSRLMWSLVEWIRSIDTSENGSEILRLLLGDLSKKLKIGRVTLIRLREEGESHIIVCKSSGVELHFEEFLRAKTPPVFSHAISIRRPIWHLDSTGESHRTIIRENSVRSGYSGRYYSIVPIESQSELLGVLALTDYFDGIKQDSIRSFIFESCFRMIAPHIARILETLEAKEEAATSLETVNFQTRIQAIREQIRTGECDDMTKLISYILNVCLSPGQAGFIANLIDPKEALLVLGIDGFNDEISKKILNGAIYAHSDNLHGPIPLAISERRPIIVSDIDQIAMMLNPVTLELLRKSNARSLAAIPIIYSAIEASDRTIWGVLWIQDIRLNGLESRHIGRFEIWSKQIASAIQMLSDHQNQRRFREMLTEFVPQHVVEKLMHGEKVQVEESGVLMMIDLKGSSKIASATSANTWSHFIKTYASPAIKEIINQYGFALHQVIWDAFFITRSNDSTNTDTLDDIISMHREITEKIDQLYDQHFASVDGLKFLGLGSLRSCFVWGDVTRGFSEGPSPVWTIVGLAMSHVMKLEAECKLIHGSLFSTADFFLDEENFVRTGVILDMTGAEIVECSGNLAKNKSA